MRVTIKDVARDAGVAISTVSKVLNGADNLRPGTRYAVEAAMRELNYIPNPNARSLKSRRKDAIGLFLSSIQGEFYTGMTQAIHAQCARAGFMLEIYVSNGNSSDEVSARILSFLYLLALGDNKYFSGLSSTMRKDYCSSYLLISMSWVYSKSY